MRRVLIAICFSAVACGNYELDPHGKNLLSSSGTDGGSDDGGVTAQGTGGNNSCDGVTCAAGQACDVATNTCVTSGPVPHGGVCTSDADCAPAICLPLQSGQTDRFCSYPQFSFTLTVATSVTCYSSSAGTFSRGFAASAGVPILSNMTKNETSCVADGLGSAGQCKESTAMNGTCNCSLLRNSGSSTPTWNCSP